MTRFHATQMACALVTLLQLGNCGPVFAQAEPPAAQSGAGAQPADDLETVVVTARRRSEALSGVPVAATVFTGAALDQQGISNLQELGNLTPGLNITSTIFIDSIFLRGVGSSPNDPGFEQQTGLFVDGVYYGNGRWVSSASFDSASVEVLSGPQGVYFGKNTIAGAVNIATRNPGDSFETVAKLGYEFNAGERYGEAVISGPLTSTFGARLAGHASKMQGWASNGNTGEGEPGSSDTVGRVTLAWTPASGFDANLKFQGQNYTDNGPTARTILLGCTGTNNTPAPLSLQGFPIWGATSGTADCNRNFEIPGQQVLREGRAFSHVPAYTSALTLHWHNDLGEWTSTSGYNHYEFGTYAGLNSSSLDAVESHEQARNSSRSTELRYQSTLRGPVNFMAGAYYQSTDFHNYLAPAILPGFFRVRRTPLNSKSSTKGKTQSYFVELLWNINEQWELDAGDRYTVDNKDSAFDTLAVAPNVAGFFPPMHFTATQRFTNSSPQATLSWRPSRDLMLYAAYKTGFLSGGFAHAQIPSPTSQISDFLFGPEKVRGGELGAKFALYDRRVEVNAAAYHYRYDGLQLSTFQPATTTFAVQNAGQSESKGIEVRSLWRPTTKLSVSATAANGSTKYTRYVGACLPTATVATGCNVALPGGGFAQDFKGFSTSFAPQWNGRLAVDYRSTLSDAASMSAGIGVNFSSHYTVGDVLNQPGWAKYDARLALDLHSWNLALIGNNLTNLAVCNQASSRPLGGVGETNCWLDRGRELRLEVGTRL